MFSHGSSSKNGLWLHLGVILGRSCSHVGLTPPNDNTQSHFAKTSHAKSPFSNSTQCPKVAPRWSQDGPTWLKMAPRWPTIVYRIYLKWRFRMGGVAKNAFSHVQRHQQQHTTTHNASHHHTPTHNNAQSRFLLGPPTQNHNFQARLSAPRWPQDGPKMAQHGSRCP